MVLPSDELTEIPADQMEWIVQTVLESERLECDFGPMMSLYDYGAAEPFYEHTCIRAGSGYSLTVDYKTYDSAAEIRIHSWEPGPLFRPNAPARREVRRLITSLEAADLMCLEFSPRRR